MLFAWMFLKWLWGEGGRFLFKSEDKEVKYDSASAITLSTDQYITVGGPWWQQPRNKLLNCPVTNETFVLLQVSWLTDWNVHRQTGWLLTYLFTYLLTYLLTPWSTVLFEKLTGFQLVKKFPAFYGTRRFITAFTSARHLSLSWASSIQSIPHTPLPEDPF